MYNHPDMKELAISLIRSIRGGTPPDESLAQSNVAQAAATIALCERLDKIIGIMQAETGYGPVESNSPTPPVEVKYELTDPPFPGDGKDDIPY